MAFRKKRFSLDFSDMPGTKSKKFGTHNTMHNHCFVGKKSDRGPTNNGEVFRTWRLQENATITEVTCFHLKNKLVGMEINLR